MADANNTVETTGRTPTEYGGGVFNGTPESTTPVTQAPVVEKKKNFLARLFEAIGNFFKKLFGGK